MVLCLPYGRVVDEGYHQLMMLGNLKESSGFLYGHLGGMQAC
jgi:hypothetical protein